MSVSARWSPLATLRLLALAVAAVLLGGCSFNGLQDMGLPGGPDVGDRPYTVTAEFSDVLGLAGHAAVKVDGVTVGEVTGIERDGWHAAVELQLPGDLELSTATRARVQQSSLLGEKFVALHDPSASGDERLGDGDRIPLVRTGRGAEVEEVLGAASVLLNGGGLDQVRTISRELHAALDSDRVDTGQFLRELSAFIGTLDRQRERIVRIMAGLSRLGATLNDDEAVVERALADIAPALRVLEQQRRPLVRMLRSLSRFGDVASRVIRESGDDLVADLEALEPIVRALRRTGDDVPASIEAILSFPFPDEVLRAARGDYVNLAVELDLSPWVLLGNTTGSNETPGGGVDPLDPLGPLDLGELLSGGGGRR